MKANGNNLWYCSCYPEGFHLLSFKFANEHFLNCFISYSLRIRIKNRLRRDFHSGQWLRIFLPVQWTWVWSLVQELRQWHPTPVLLPGMSHGWRSLEGCSPWGRWGWDTTERLNFHFSLSCFGEGNGNPLQCSCLENPRDGEAWWAAIYGVAQSRTRLKRLSSSSGRTGDGIKDWLKTKSCLRWWKCSSTGLWW